MSQKTDRIEDRKTFDPLHVVSFYKAEILRGIIEELINGRYTYIGYRKSYHGNCWVLMFHRYQKDYWGDTVSHTSNSTWEREEIISLIHALRSAGITKFKQIQQTEQTDLNVLETMYEQAVEPVVS